MSVTSPAQSMQVAKIARAVAGGDPGETLVLLIGAMGCTIAAVDALAQDALIDAAAEMLGKLRDVLAVRAARVEVARARA